MSSNNNNNNYNEPDRNRQENRGENNRRPSIMVRIPYPIGSNRPNSSAPRNEPSPSSGSRYSDKKK